MTFLHENRLLSVLDLQQLTYFLLETVDNLLSWLYYLSFPFVEDILILIALFFVTFLQMAVKVFWTVLFNLIMIIDSSQINVIRNLVEATQCHFQPRKIFLALILDIFSFMTNVGESYAF